MASERSRTDNIGKNDNDIAILESFAGAESQVGGEDGEIFSVSREDFCEKLM